ncbi:protein ANTAGONIST OF LIKE HETEROCHROMATIN PROTEIN 1-like [Xenopus laevis]|uniref:Protein ANTAGONIST OF LIKE HETEROCHROMATIN PROTEIN 1-like n=1 Tax=Xenopus laevis TaxID=8355 RepID=A0A8J0VA19_XENLA|nr:protein ANTAGONIST OF LIKE HETEROCHROMATIN PROTEIN 1-like [Xenopus laevis]
MSSFYTPRHRAALAIALVCSLKKKNRRKRSVWSKEWLLKRETLSHMALLQELREHNPEDFKNYLRMSDSCFEVLLEAVSPLIQRQDTVMRKSISPEQRLIATLRFLATGRTFEDLKFSTGISAQALGHIIPDTCRAIVEALKQEYLQFPSTPEEWLQVAKQFEDYWNFPNCGGAIDGKHVRINPPPNSGSYYYNYKGYFSVILLAVVNAKYEFIMVDIGKNGRVSDGGVIEQTLFYQKLKEKQLQLPSNSETKEGLNFVFVADEAFALHENLIKPFPQKTLTPARKIFNYRLSRARRVVENAFGILANRFRIFHTTINLSPQKIDIIVFACCILHNFLRRNNANSYTPSNLIDQEDIHARNVIPGEWRNENNGFIELQGTQAHNNTRDAKSNRDRYVDYFTGVGAVDWQSAMV